MKEQALQYVQENRAEFLERLMELVRIPSVSTLPEHRPDLEWAAGWLADALRRIGMQGVDLLDTGGAPVVYGEWLAAGEGAPTVLAYGHYDVQPADPVKAWDSPPFEPVVRGDDLYGRGASDDKGQLYAVLAAAEAYLQTSSRLPVNLKVMIEGEEEVSSPHMAQFVRRERERLAAGVVVVVDEALLDPQTPLIMYGLRGGVSLEVEVRGPAHDLHSGTFGGVVDNPFNVLVRLLAACQDGETRRVTIPGFYDRVQPPSDEERARLARVPLTDEVARELTGAPVLAGEAGYTVLERASLRPTFEIYGMPGGFVGVGKKSVIPARAAAKVSMRLVPDQEPMEIAWLLEQYLRALAPPTVALGFQIQGASRPVVVDPEAPAIQAMAQALEMGYGRPPVYMRSGGSEPAVPVFQDVLGAPVVLIGFGLPDDHIHAPNEKIHLPTLYRGVETLVHYLALLAT